MTPTPPEPAAPAPRGVATVFAGGGTAGHVLPGIAVANALVARGHDPASIHFVVSERGSERSLVVDAGYPVTALPGRGIQRRLSPSAIVANVGAVGGLVLAVVRAFALVRRVRPGAVVVLGGFASAAAALAAAVLRVPLVVAEQNARAGAVSRLAGRVAVACALPFPDTDLPKGTLTGNPVRAEVLAVDRAGGRDAARAALDLPLDRTVVAVFAGSLGATRINTAVSGLAERWSDRADLAIRHVVGDRDWDAAAAAPGPSRDDGLLYQRIRYEDRMDLLLAAADLVVCRSGGTTVAEISVVGCPAVLVPLPIATRDHQRANAAALVDAGAAVLLPDAEVDAGRLDEIVSGLIAAPGRLTEMAAAARTVALPEAADRVADLIEAHARVRR